MGNTLKENLSQGYVIRISQDAASGECALHRAAAFFEHQSKSHCADQQYLQRSRLDAETLKKTVLMEFGEIKFEDQTVSFHDSRNGSKPLKFMSDHVLNHLYEGLSVNVGFCKKFNGILIRFHFAAFTNLVSPNAAD
jgi:hypothetical protein